MKNPKLLLIPLLMAFACKPAEQGDVVIADVNVIDVIEGKIIEGQDVIIEGDKIKRILPHGQFKLQSAQLVDGKGKFLIPGLWDMHVHIRQYEEIFLPLFVTQWYYRGARHVQPYRQ